MRLRTKPATESVTKRNPLRIWHQAVRFHFVPPSILPAVLGSVIAWSRFRVFDLSMFLLVVVGVTINHFGLNMMDDVFDYLQAVDRSEGEEKNPYTGGSGVLTEGLLSVREMLTGAVLCFVTTALIGFYLAYRCGWVVILLGVIGMASSLFYTMPPIKFGYRGFGELGLLVNFGPIIALGSYYVQTEALALEPLLASLILGLMMWSMVIINEIPDYDEDRRGGKWNLVARFGREAGIGMYTAGLVAAYTVLFFCILLDVTPFLTFLGFASIPLTLKSLRLLKAHYLDKMKLIPANLTMIRIHTLTGLSLIAGYILHGVL